ncbi:MAG TPA: protein prkA, partial [Nitrolancea sp.]|nr:protein prkA [Nitrolancea sp.]
MNLQERLEAFRAEEQKLNWEGTFADYFDLVISDPRLAQLSHARVFNMLMDTGTEVDEDGNTHYNFFTGEIFGIERSLEQIVEYFRSSAQRLEVRKRILLLMGPVGGGKSTIVAMLKRGLERYTRTDQGALYAIKHCPMHEEPLHLVPESIRDELAQ